MVKELDQTGLEASILYQYCLPEWRRVIELQKVDVVKKKGDLLFKAGEPVQGVYFVYSGLVKIHQDWGGAKELIIRFAKAGDMIGYRGLGFKKEYPISATALAPTKLWFISLSFFESTLEVNHRLTHALMEFYADELQRTEHRMRTLVQMDVKSRIADMLLALKAQFGVNAQGAIAISLARQDMAAYVGATYETFFRMSAEMIQAEIIKIHGKHITILNEPALIALGSIY